jgi:hypothetical protein
MDIIPLTSFNGPTIYFMSCHGSSILFTEVLYAGCMVLELCSRAMSCLCLGLRFHLKKYGMLIAWLLDSYYSASGVLKHV